MAGKAALWCFACLTDWSMLLWEADRFMPVILLFTGMAPARLDVEDPDVMRELIEGTLVEELDELTDILRAPTSCDVFNVALLDRTCVGSGGSLLISPALSTNVFLFGFAGTVTIFHVSLHGFHRGRCTYMRIS